jgi:hypothetical protein
MTFYKNLQCDTKSGPPYLASTCQQIQAQSKHNKQSQTINQTIGDQIQNIHIHNNIIAT